MSSFEFALTLESRATHFAALAQFLTGVKFGEGLLSGGSLDLGLGHAALGAALSGRRACVCSNDIMMRKRWMVGWVSKCSQRYNKILLHKKEINPWKPVNQQ